MTIRSIAWSALACRNGPESQCRWTSCGRVGAVRPGSAGHQFRRNDCLRALLLQHFTTVLRRAEAEAPCRGSDNLVARFQVYGSHRHNDLRSGNVRRHRQTARSRAGALTRLASSTRGAMTFNASTYANMVTQGPPRRRLVSCATSGRATTSTSSSSARASAAASWPTTSPTGSAAASGSWCWRRASFIYPTHVYNLCRFPNCQLARSISAATRSGRPATKARRSTSARSRS